MGHRGSEGSRMPSDWRGQRTGRSRSHAAPALEAGDGGSGPAGDDDTHGADGGFGSGEWQAPGPDAGRGYTDDGLAGLARGSAARGPARGFPPAPDQPDPVYPGDDFDPWSQPADTGSWAAQDDAAQRGHPPWDPAAAEGEQWDGEGHWGEEPGGPEHGSPEHGGPEHGGPEHGGHWNQGAVTASWPAAAPETGEWAGQGQAGQWAEGDEAGDWDGTAGHWQDQGAHWNSATGEWEAQDPGWGTGATAWPDGGESGPPSGAWPSPGHPAGYDDYTGERDPGDDFGAGPSGRGARDGRKKPGVAGKLAALRGGAAGGSRNRTVILAAAGAVVVAALAATAYTFLAGHSATNSPGNAAAAPKLPTNQPTATNTSAGAKLGKWQYITSRATDKSALTLGELYPAQFLINGSSFVRTVDRSDKDCNAGLFGSQLQSAAQSSGCTQVLRASYESSDGKMMGTVGVVNLTNANGAAKAGQATGADNFITPLAGTAGPTKNMSNGTGVVQAEYKGHYLILIFAEFTNLRSPSTATQRTRLETFSSDLISGSANIALSNRMVNGHP
ncbi:MAG TPA: hypothetical protein VGN41_18365 [Streptosporangiaceae bacterium]